jgi:hypothetical protein
MKCDSNHFSRVTANPEVVTPFTLSAASDVETSINFVAVSRLRALHQM